MSIRFQADNDLKRIIVDATLRHESRIDFQTAQAARLDGLDDEAVLRQAALQSRILVSHDKRTMPAALASFVASGGTSPGVLLVIPQGASIPCRRIRPPKLVVLALRQESRESALNA